MYENELINISYKCKWYADRCTINNIKKIYYTI